MLIRHATFSTSGRLAVISVPRSSSANGTVMPSEPGHDVRGGLGIDSGGGRGEAPPVTSMAASCLPRGILRTAIVSLAVSGEQDRVP